MPRRYTASTAAINNDRPPNPNNVNAKAISPQDAPKGYTHFEKGVAAKMVLDPPDLWAKAA